MDPCAISTNWSALDRPENFRSVNSNEFSLDANTCDEPGLANCLRCLFDRYLPIFFEENSVKETVRPMPAILGGGRCADFYELFWVVKKRGGYDSVSKKNMWATVAEECGIDLSLSASLKLIYYKYLDGFDQWLLRIVRDKRFTNLHCKLDEHLNFENGFRGLLAHADTLKDSKDMHLERNKNRTCIELKIDDSRMLDIVDDDEKNETYDHNDDERTVSDNSDDNSNDDEDDDGDSDSNDDDDGGDEENTQADLTEIRIQSSNKCFGEREFEVNLRKRKQESLSETLNWIIQIAKQPYGTSIGTQMEGVKGKNNHGGGEFWEQALLIREALFLERHVTSTAKQRQKKLKMQPSMYEDHATFGNQSTERLRCSDRIPIMKSHLCPCCNPSSVATQNKMVLPLKAQSESSPKLQTQVTPSMLTIENSVRSFNNNPLEKKVSVGPLYQAEVPVWTSVVYESDPKWLGTQIWPLYTLESNFIIARDPVGKGRPDFCDCPFPNSVKCVRFHIAEKRMKLKHELGSVFYRWRFDSMGEEVSLRWTSDEEKRFKSFMRLNSSSLHRYFPPKTRENLVSYYFNVFVIQQRSYQNRVTPKSIDSDDESEFGSVSEDFGHEAVKIPGSTSLICMQNRECTDWE